MPRLIRFISNNPQSSPWAEEPPGRLSLSWAAPAAEDTKVARHQTPVFNSLSKWFIRLLKLSSLGNQLTNYC